MVVFVYANSVNYRFPLVSATFSLPYFLMATFCSQNLADKAEQGKKVSGEKLPIAGTRFTKEHNGKWHDVLVTDEGFIYEGQFFTSLSKVAGKITGTNWNGPAFFGLRNKRKDSVKLGENNE